MTYRDSSDSFWPLAHQLKSSPQLQGKVVPSWWLWGMGEVIPTSRTQAFTKCQTPLFLVSHRSGCRPAWDFTAHRGPLWQLSAAFARPPLLWSAHPRPSSRRVCRQPRPHLTGELPIADPGDVSGVSLITASRLKPALAADHFFPCNWISSPEETARDSQTALITLLESKCRTKVGPQLQAYFAATTCWNQAVCSS